MTNKLPDTIINRLIYLYVKEELPALTISRQLNISVSTILKYLRDNNVPIKLNKSHIKNIPTNKIIGMYSVKRLSSNEIANELGYSSTTILRILSKNNIKIRPRGHNEYPKNRIAFNELPPIIKEPQIINQKLTGIVNCPICFKTRRLYSLTRPRIKTIVNSNGRCNLCAMKARALQLDINEIKHCYEKERLTTKQIADRFNVKNGVIRRIIEQNNITTRKKGLLKTKVIYNKGTIEQPVIGDIRKGYELGYNNKDFYMRVTCKICGKSRWEYKSRIDKFPFCKPCAMKLNGERHRGENAPTWLGGISFEPYTPIFNEELKERIRSRDNYTCQLCGLPQNGKKLSCHHIDYNKTNSHPNNLISLCPSKPNSCHSKTNYNRPYWTEYFTKLLKSKGLYITDK